MSKGEKKFGRVRGWCLERRAGRLALFTEETTKRLKMDTEARVPMGILVEIAARLALL